MKKWYIILLLTITSFPSAFSQAEWPDITSENKPWTRWWWLGNAVDTANLGILMETYAKAGLGGLEIVPIYGVKGSEDQYLPYLGTEWIQALQYTLKKAKDLNIGIDMANGTGWPFGGSWVTPHNASKHLAHLSYDLHEGESVAGNLRYTEQYIRTVARHSPVIDQARKSEQIKPFRVMAYDSAGTALDLTSQVDDNGKLNWTAPRGNWKVIALFVAGHGKMVERAAPGAEGFAIDHFAEPALMQYLQHFDSAFAGMDISGIRCMFNDSYEVDDAYGQADWTASLPDEFAKRRGYDLFQYLPALLSNDSGHALSPVIYDYRLTISELLLERFTQPWRQWTNGHDALTRNQAHGSPANILDLYAASDIPETEGADILRFKFATSAGHVTGKRLISAEAATWLNDHFISTLADVKVAADKYFLGGVNHLIYHGTAYSPVSDPWPGWLFYAAVHFQPTNPMWEQFPALNSYIARTQSFLQQGQADNDVLLYYPLADRLCDRGDQFLRHFDGMEKEFHGTGFESCTRQMMEQGYTADFISDRQLQQTTVENNLIRTSGATYQTIVIPDCRYMPYKSWQCLFDLVKSGATVVFYKSAPVEVPGLKAHETNQPEFTKLWNTLTFDKTGMSNIRQAIYGHGKFLMAGDLSGMLEYAGARRESFISQQLQFVRRKTGNNTLYFIHNNGQQPFDGWIPLQCYAAAAELFDAFSGLHGKAAIRRQTNGTPEIYLRLKPSASILVMTYPDEIPGEPFPYYHPSGPSATIGTTWTVDFINGGPSIPTRRQITGLTSWTDWEEETKFFSGLARYTTSFRRPPVKADYYLLNLGKVYDCADVMINGEPVATLIGPDFSVVVDATTLKKKNRIDIVVANRMANRIIDMENKGMVYKKFHNVNFPAYKRENAGADGLFSAAQWEPFPAGLNGPVTLTPVEIINRP